MKFERTKFVIYSNLRKQFFVDFFFNQYSGIYSAQGFLNNDTLNIMNGTLKIEAV